MAEEINNHDTQIAVIMTEIGYIKDSIREIKSLLTNQNNTYVTKEQFAPVRLVVYGMVGVILSAFITGLILLVWKT